jgi:hypothetical protein
VIVSRLTLALITAIALATSYFTVSGFIDGHGGDLWHIYGTPACLELAALCAAYRAHRTGDKVAWLLFWLPLAATVGINVAHGYPNYVLMAVYAIPPIAAVGVGDLFLRDMRDAAQAKAQVAQAKARLAEETARRGPQAAAQEPAQPRTPAAHTNGHKPRTATPTADTLATLVPDTAAVQMLLEEYGTVQLAADSLGVTRGQLQAHRRKIGDLKT